MSHTESQPPPDDHLRAGVPSLDLLEKQPEWPLPWEREWWTKKRFGVAEVVAIGFVSALVAEYVLPW